MDEPQNEPSIEESSPVTPLHIVRDPLRVGWTVADILDEEEELISVGPDAKFETIRTYFLLHQISQVPVLDGNRRRFDGTVTWQSIALHKDPYNAKARDLTAGDKDRKAARLSDQILDFVDEIYEHDYIYVIDDHCKYTGIITAADLVTRFKNMSGDFLTLREIEQRLRAIIDARFSARELEEFKASSDGDRTISSAHDLTLGEYVRILEHPKRWHKLKLQLDRGPIVDNLKKVRDIRNSVAHFKPKGVTAADRRQLDMCLNWLRDQTDENGRLVVDP